MVAVVSGSGLGLFGMGAGGNAQVGRGRDRVYVNTTTGNLVVQGVDDTLSAVGLDFAAVRTYNSQGFTDEDNGDQWRLGVHMRLSAVTGGTGVNTAGSQLTKTFGDGAEVVYSYNTTRGRYESTAGDRANDFLTWNGTVWTWTDGSARNTEEYALLGAVQRIKFARDVDGNTVTYNYNVAGSLLTSINLANPGSVANNAQTVTFTYGGTAGTNLLSIGVTSWNGTALASQTLTSYTYDTSNRLQTVRVDLTPANGSDSLTYTTTYSYDGTSKRIASITQTDGSSVTFTYQNLNGDYRLRTATDAEGRVTTFTYTNVTGTGTAAVYQQTDVLDALGLTTTYTKDASGRLLSALTPAVGGARIETRYTYDPATGNVATIAEDPTGLNRVTTFTYDANTGLLLTTRDSLGNTVARSYNANNQLETETSYLVRDPDGAGPSLPSSPLTARFLYDSEHHLRFAISADGRVLEHVYNANGERITSYRYAANTYSGTWTETALGTWATAQRANALERIDYAYDFRSNLSTITTGAASVTRFVYDQRGLLLSTVEARGEATATPTNDYVTNYTYDGLGRAQTTSTWVSGSEIARTLQSIVYDDANRRTVSTFANGLTKTETFDRAGELVGVAMGPGALGTTSYTYDGDGRLRVTTDPTGVRSYCFYDEAGRKIGSVDGDGSLVEHVYDRAHQLIKTIRYATRLSGTTQTSLAGTGWNTIAFTALRTEANATAASNQITRNIYDAAGLLVFTIDEIGAVRQNVYDGAGRLIDQIRFFNTQAIAASVDEVLPAGITVAPHAQDRHTRSFYNGDGQLTGTLDGAGYLKENIYDAAGRLITSIGYFNASDASRWINGTLDTLRPGSAGSTAQLDAARDIRTRFFYDAQGRKVGTLDGERYLTELVHDVAGNVLQSIRYDRVLTDTGGTTTFAALKTAAAGATTDATLYTYDGVGQVLSETNFENSQTVYSYDVAGNLIATTRANGAGAEARTTRTRYDVLGRATQELTAQGSAALAALGATPTQAQIDDVWSKYGIAYGYDAAGRRVSMTVRPNDAQTSTTYYYYDNDGRLRFELDALGRVTENRYDALGQRTDRIAYWRSVTLSSPTGGLLNPTLIAQLSGTESANVHEKTSYGYSLRGEITSTLSAAGAATASSFNVFGELQTSTAGSGFTAFEYTYDARGYQKLTRRGTTTFEDRTYDAFGRLTSVVDARGNATTVAFDRLGREITSAQAGDANARVTAYDGFSRVLTVRDKLLNSTNYSYDDSARAVTVTTPEGIAVTTTHNRHGETLSVTANGNTASFVYDLNGALTSASDTLGALETRAYDRAGRQIEARDERGTITTFAYDAANRLLTRTVDTAAGGLALATTYAYDPLARVMTVTEPGNRVTRTEYDRDGRVAALVFDPAGNASRTEYQYDAANHTTLVTEGAGSAKPRRTQYVYDALGRRTDEYVDPASIGGAGALNLRTQYRFDNADNLTRTIDANGNSTWYVYDAQDRLVQTIDALGGVTARSYDAQDRVSVTRRHFNTVAVGALGDTPVLQSVAGAPNDAVTRSVYDRDGREKYTLATLSAAGSSGAVTSETAVVTERSFDAGGNVTRTRVYRNAINVPSTVDPASVATALTSAGNSTTVLHAADRVEWTAYDLRGRAVFAVDGSGAVIESKYDLAGNVVATVAYAERVPLGNPMTAASLTTWSSGASIANNPANRATRFWFDTLNRQRVALDAEGYLHESRHLDATRQEQSIEYAGKPIIAANATLAQVEAAATAAPNPSLNQVTTQTLDAAGRVVQLTDAEGRSEYYGYDAVGNKTKFVNKRGASADDTAFTWNYEYDANRRLIFERTPLVDITTVNESVPGAGVLVAETVNARLVTRFEYDALGNLRFQREAYGTTRERATEYRYDALGRQTRTVLPSVGVYDPSAGDAQLGNGAAVSRTEGSPPLYSEIAYDALGNAFRSRDVAGNYSYKAYDALGRVTHEVDALGLVTSYDHDTFGNRTLLTRYASALSSALSATGTSLLSADVTARLTPNPTLDRAITTTYDRLNRVVQVTQPSVSNFEPNAGSAGGTTFTGGATTLSDYDAFGMLVRTRRLATSAPSYADTFYYYDRLGQKTAEVDPLGYLTTYEYDETGDVRRQVEYARARTGTLDTSTYGVVTTTTRANAPEHAAGYDRETTFTYDRLNRKKSETRVDIDYTELNATATDVSAAHGDQVTSYEYDALGNQTRLVQSIGANSLSTWTYYDVLGRVIAVAEPARDPGDGSTLIPYTRMARDSFGNLVQQTVYGGGAVSIPASGLPGAASAPAASPNRLTTLLLDGRGNAIRTTDASTANRFASYDARGQIAKEWQVVVNPGDPATAADDLTETLVTIYRYDALGRETEVIEPQRHTGASTVSVRKVAQYDAFGAIVLKGVVGAQGVSGTQEYFDYDQAGRVWRTNSGDGIHKVFLYDLAGNVTAELRSQSVDLKSNGCASAQDVVNNVAAVSLMRTESRYDARGSAVEQRLPAFTVSNGIEQMAAAIEIGTVAGAPVTNAVYVHWLGLADATVEMRFEYRVAGSNAAFATASIVALPGGRLGANVHELYNQTYEYRISYRRLSAVAAHAESRGTFRVDRNITTTLAISQSAPDPAAEVATLALTQSNGIISWAAPADTSVTAILRYKVTGAPAWAPELGAARTGASFEVNVRTALADAGNYDYEIEYRRGATVIAKQAGQLTSTGTTAQRNVSVSATSENPLSTYNQPIPVPNVSGRILTWPAPGDATITPSFEYKLPSASNYSQLTVERASSWSVNLAGLANDTYSYRIQYRIGNRVVAEQTGTFSIAANGSITITTAGVTRDAAPPATELVSNISGAGSLLGASYSGVASQTGISGYDYRYPTTVYKWSGSNSMNLSWRSVGAQAVRVVVDYSTLAYQSSTSVATSTEQVFASGGAGVTFTWGSTNSVYYTYSEFASIRGGINASAPIRVRVYGQDAGGAYTVLLRDSSSAATTPALLAWSAPADTALTPTFRYLSGGSWITRATTQSGSTVSVELSDLAQGTYSYELRYTKSGAVSIAAGSFQISGVTAIKLSQGNSTQDPYWLTPAASGSRVNWALAPQAGTTVQFSWYNGSSWVVRAHDTDGTNYSVDMTGMAAGAYLYQINYVRSGESWSYAKVTGTLTVGVTTQTVPGAVTLSATSNVVNPAARITPITFAGDTIAWSLARQNAADTIRVLYTINGTTYTATVAGSGPNYSAAFAQLPVGTATVAWSIEYLRPGETDAYARASGQATCTLYYSQSASVSSVSSQTGVTGYDYRYPLTVYQWSGSNSVSINWASVGVQAVRVVFDYYTLGYASSTSTAANITQDFASGGTGVTLGWGATSTRWYDSMEFVPIKGGIDAARPIVVRVYGRDASGNYSVLLRDSTVVLPPPQITVNSQAGVYPSGVQQIAAPADLGNGSMGWTTAPLAGATVMFRYDGIEVATTAYGSGRKVDLSALGAGSHNYEITYVRSGESNPYARAAGTFMLARGAGPATQTSVTLDTALSTDPAVNGADPLDTAVNIGAMNRPSDPAGGYLVQETISTGGGRSTYRIEWSPFNGAYDRYGAFIPGYSVSAGRYLYWSDPPTTLADATRKFEYRAAGSGAAWTELTIDKIFDGSGTRFLGVSVAGLAAGSFEYRIRYLRAGESTAFAVRTGVMTNPASAGSTVLDTTAAATRNSASVLPRTQQAYDRWGNVIAVVDALNATTNLRYDQSGQLIEKKLPTVQIVSVAAADGRISTSSDRPTQRNYYDLLGRLIATRDGNGNLSTARVNHGGQVIRTTNADATFKSHSYDAFGNRTGQLDERGYRTRYTFDGLDQLTKTEQEAVVGAIAGNVAASVVTLKYAYDQAGRRIVETDGNDLSTRYWFDLTGNVVRRVTASNAATTYAYDLLGNKITETDAIGGVKNWSYDYFGRLQTHTELGTFTYTPDVATHTWSTTYTPGYLHTYTYDLAGLALTHRSTAGIDVAMKYDAAGHLVRISETGSALAASGLETVKRETRYAYDALGRHAREQSVIDGVVHADARISYDAAGRMSAVWDLGAGVVFSYDAHGNRTRLLTQSNSANNAQTGEFHAGSVYDRYWNYLSQGWFTAGKTLDQAESDYWYRYDSMNRLVLSRGWNVNGNVVADTATTGKRSVELGYDATGNRNARRAYGTRYAGSAGTNYSIATDYSLEQSLYDGLGRLTQSTKDGIGVGTYVYDKASRQRFATTATIEGNALVTREQQSVYGNDGRLLSQTTRRKTTANSDGFREESVLTFGESQWQMGFSGNTPTSGWTLGYDAAGALRGYQVAARNANGDPTYTSTYRSTYRSGETYLETRQDHSATGEGAPLPSDTQKKYDLNGNLIAVLNSVNAWRNRYFTYDTNGQIATAVKGELGTAPPVAAFASAVKAANTVDFGHHYFANAANVGRTGSLSTPDPSSGVPALGWYFEVDDGTVDGASVAAPAQVIAIKGDTLRRIALRIYGDANLWYVLADENGISDPDQELPEGLALRIPNRVVSLANSAEVFKPFDAGQIIGDTSPALIFPPPPAPKKGCGVLGMVLMVAVMVVATVFTAGVAAGFMGAGFSGGVGGIMAVGSSVLAGAGVAGVGTLGLIGAAAIGGAVGSAVSQGVGIAMGVQDDFDWKAVAAGALSAGIGAGMGAAVKAAQAVALGGRVTALSKIGAFLGKIGSVGRAALGNALTQGIGVATGLQSSFNWKQVATAAVSAPVADFVGSAVGSAAAGPLGNAAGAFIGDFAGRVAAGYVARELGGKMSTQQILLDAFGNALGNSLSGITPVVDYQDKSLWDRVTSSLRGFGDRNFGALMRLVRNPDRGAALDRRTRSAPATTAAQAFGALEMDMPSGPSLTQIDTPRPPTDSETWNEYFQNYSALKAYGSALEDVAAELLVNDEFYLAAMEDLRTNSYDSDFARISGINLGLSGEFPVDWRADDVDFRQQFAMSIDFHGQMAEAIAARGYHWLGASDGPLDLSMFSRGVQEGLPTFRDDTITYFGSRTTDPRGYTVDQWDALRNVGMLDLNSYSTVKAQFEMRWVDRGMIVLGAAQIAYALVRSAGAIVNGVRSAGAAAARLARQIGQRGLQRLARLISGEMPALDRVRSNARLIPGTAAHKAARWEAYQLRTGGARWNYERWSNVYNRNMNRARVANAAAEAYRRRAGYASGQTSVDVTLDGQVVARRLDGANVARKQGLEYKTGTQYASADNLYEVARDGALVQAGWDVRWVFGPGARASNNLLIALQRAGIRSMDESGRLLLPRGSTL